MYEITGKQYTLSGSGMTATYFEHRYNYVRGRIRNPRDIEDIQAISREYYDDIITQYTDIDLNFKREKKCLRDGVYDGNEKMYTLIQEVSCLYKSKRVYNSVERLIKKSRKRVDSDKPRDKTLYNKQSLPKLHAEFKQNADGVITLPSGDSGTYVELCRRVYHLTLTNRDDLKTIIGIVQAKGKSEALVLNNVITTYWYDEIAAAFMLGYLSYALVSDRELIDRVSRVAERKGESAVVEKRESQLLLKFSRVDWAGERPSKEWSVFDNE